MNVGLPFLWYFLRIISLVLYLIHFDPDLPQEFLNDHVRGCGRGHDDRLLIGLFQYSRLIRQVYLMTISILITTQLLLIPTTLITSHKTCLFSYSFLFSHVYESNSQENLFVL
jgi:hypothetical protein